MHFLGEFVAPFSEFDVASSTCCGMVSARCVTVLTTHEQASKMSYRDHGALVPYCNHLARGTWESLSTDSSAVGLCGPSDVDAVNVMSLNGKREGCGRPMHRCQLACSATQFPKWSLSGIYVPPARLIMPSWPISLTMSFKGLGCLALDLALMW